MMSQSKLLTWRQFLTFISLKQGQLKWKREVFEVREDINVSEWVYGHDGTVSWSFLDTEQRMAELTLVHVKKVYWPRWGNVNIINTCVTYI